MKKRSVFLGLAIAVLTIAGAADFYAQGSAGIKVDVSLNHEIRYVSGKAAYVEALQEGRWVGRYWSADGRIEPARFWGGDDAFKIRVTTRPTAPQVPGTSLSTGWQWVGYSESPGSHPGTRDAVVELNNSACPIGIKIHTLLDGTPVLTRWLEITNKSSEPIALTGLSPWSGRLWADNAPV